jgi:hypothetical protein
LLVGGAAPAEPPAALVGSKGGDSRFSGLPGGWTSWCP